MQNNSRIKILVASEFAVFRRGLISLIEVEKDFTICGEASNPNEIFNIASETNPDLIILNLKLSSDLLNSLCKNIHVKYPHLPVLLFLEETLEISIPDLIINGVRGIIWKENSKYELIDAIRCVANGRSFFEDPDNCRLNCHLSRKICEKNEDTNTDNLLSERETEVLKLIAKGLSYKEIAANLMISTRTVESHKNNIMAKLDLTSKYELIRYSIEKFNM